MMQEVGRILYAHVPTAWVALVTYCIAFVASVGTLWTNRFTWDATTTAAVEVGLLLNVMLLFQGSLWAKPTWGVYWTWDPRLTTTAVMAVSFVGVLVLRGLIHRPERRMTVSGIATILAGVNVPLVYYSVNMWNSLHQTQSSPSTVDSQMVIPLRIAAFGMLFIALGFIGIRRRLELGRLEIEADAGDMPSLPTPLSL
jgi:heme exporter protein C